MVEPSDLKALYALLREGMTTIEMAERPDCRSAQALDLLAAALAMIDDLIQKKPDGRRKKAFPPKVGSMAIRG